MKNDIGGTIVAGRVDEEMKRPTLSDPKEFAIVKQVYFPKDVSSLPVDVAERLDRVRRRRNFSRTSSR